MTMVTFNREIALRAICRIAQGLSNMNSIGTFLPLFLQIVAIMPSRDKRLVLNAFPLSA